MPALQGTALVGGGIVTMLLFPMLAGRLLRNASPDGVCQCEASSRCFQPQTGQGHSIAVHRPTQMAARTQYGRIAL